MGARGCPASGRGNRPKNNSARPEAGEQHWLLEEVGGQPAQRDRHRAASEPVEAEAARAEAVDQAALQPPTRLVLDKAGPGSLCAGLAT
jgi:hypothetical protein